MAIQSEEVLKATLESFGATLVAVGEAGSKACPPSGEDFKQSLIELKKHLSPEASPESIAETQHLLEAELQAWGDSASQVYTQKSGELKEVLLIVANAASDVAKRDEKYAQQFSNLTDRLQATAQMDDISLMRKSLVQGVQNLKTCVSGMTKEGQMSLADLRSRMGAYEARLAEMERAASRDPITELMNRRALEQQLNLRVEQKRPFSVLYLDLNGFKQVNDSLGHHAGDDVLKQFAGELRTAFRSGDVVGRWGGDEFLVIIDGGSAEADMSAKRITEWINGEYTISSGSTPCKVNVSAAIGIAAWQRGEGVTELLQRADAAMYKYKTAMKAAR